LVKGENRRGGARDTEATQRVETQPVVSVVIPARNEEKWIAACLESVLRDGFRDKEIIVVDDASEDHTTEILTHFPVTVIRNEKPVGPSSARNIGAKKARGEIIALIDAHCIVDDVQWIGKFIRFFEDSEVGAVAGYLRRLPGLKGASQRFRVRSQLRVIKSANAAYRKALFEQVGGFDPSMEWAGDLDLTCKICRSQWRVVHSRDIQVVHAEKLWSVRRAFLYGTYFFPLLKKYPPEMVRSSVHLFCVGIGLLLTLGIITDLFYRLPVAVFSLLVSFSIFNGAAHGVSLTQMLRDGFYSTIWAFAYYLGAIAGVTLVPILGSMRAPA